MTTRRQCSKQAAATRFNLNVEGSPIRVGPAGGMVQVRITTDRTKQDSFQGPIALNLNLQTLPPFVQLQTPPQQMGIAQGQNFAVISLGVAPNSPPGDKQISVVGTAQGTPNPVQPVTTQFTVSVQKK